ncbi:MAG TPA: peptidoglycan-binding protein [Syntrophomonadaceae bacterium]|nr:peptidoglycan-binding protein [Syntrophomonadaceae bacterium]
MLRLRNIILIIGIFSFILFPVQPIEANNSVQKSTTPSGEVRVDGTDFPALYLSDPPLKGDAIWLLQAQLRDLGYGLEPNGIYDPYTCEMVQLFQIANNMKANGVVTSSVWKMLLYGQESEPCLSNKEIKKDIWMEIDLDKHLLTVFENDKVIKKYPVGIGTSDTHSPLGEWAVVHKAVGWGNGFGTRWMGLNVPWGIYGIHGTNKPWSVGRSESHGCIRMLNRDVEALYELVSLGTRVRIIEHGQIFPSDFSGRKLSKNSSGKNVTYLQSRLREKGIIFDNVDGRFGNMTELAVKYYQVWNGLTPTGEADEETFRSLGMIK